MVKIRKCPKCNKIAKIAKIKKSKDSYIFSCGCGIEGESVIVGMDKGRAINYYNASLPCPDDLIITIRITENSDICISCPPVKTNKEWEKIMERIECCRERIIESVKDFAK
jgi:hypothetical protein